MSAFYNSALEAFLGAYFLGNRPDFDMNLSVCAVDATYVFSADHSTTDDLGLNVVGGPIDLTNVSLTDGIVKADGIQFTEMTAGDVINAVVIFADWEGGSQLICYLDSASAATFPLTVLGSSSTIAWDDSGIFKI